MCVCVCVCVCGDILLDILVPQFMLAHYWKANKVKRRGQKNIQNKAVQIKLNLCVCACVYVTNTDIMDKD